MKHLCPVCQIEMKSTANRKLFSCPTQRSVILPGMNEETSYWDAGILFGPDNIKHWQMYEIPPYRIRIYDRHPTNGNKTIISKIIIDPNHDGIWQYEDVFTVDAVIQLPWDNYDQIIEKIKLYTTFS